MYKIVVVGDAACGKTTLLLSATRGAFPEVIDTTTMQYSSKVKIAGKNAEFELHDTFGTDESQRQRVSLYPGTDVFVVCYSIISPYSFDNVRTKVHLIRTRYSLLNSGYPKFLVTVTRRQELFLSVPREI
jgi:small GTP-binding protein